MQETFRSESGDLGRLLQLDAVNRFVLDNGLTVLHLEDRSAALVSAQLWVRTGSIHEGKHLGAGLSHYLEHLLFKGTTRRGDGVIAREVQEHGGDINAYTTYDRTVYYLDLPAEHAGFALDLLADMAFHARLDEEEILLEREVILREIAMGRDDPDRQLSRAGFQSAFKVHPYRFPVIGHEALFNQLTPDDLRAYYRSRYTPANMVLVVVGAINDAELRAELKATFDPVPARAVEPVWIPGEPPQLAGRSERLRKDVQICRGVMAFRIPHLAHPDAPGLDVLATILGRGQSSLLWRELREERRLVHHISATCWNPGEVGLFWITYACEPHQREIVETAIQALIGGLVNRGFDEAQVAKARRLALVDEVNVRKTMSGQASRLGAAEVVVGDLGFTEVYFRALAAVTADSLARLIVRYLNPDRLSCVSVNALDAEPAPSAASATLRAPDAFEMKTLGNGARLIWQRDSRLPKVHLRLSGLGGALHEPPAKRGVTALLATLLTRDSRWQTANEVAEAVESVGGSFRDYAGNNTFGLSLEVLTEDLPLARILLEDAVLNPRWDEASFVRERDALLADLRESQDDIVDHGRRAMRRRFFGEHPMAVEPGGELETIKAITLEDVRNLYHHLMLASNLVLTVVGDIDPEKDLAAFETFLLDLPDWAFRVPKVPFSGPVPGDERETMEREQTVVFLAYPDVGVTSAEDLQGQLLDAICSDMSSELFKQVREDRGLAYFVATQRTVGLDCGQFTFYAGTRPDAADEVLSVLRAEAARLREEGPSQAEIDRARARLKARMRMSLHTPASRATHVSLNLHYGRPLNDWEDYDQRLDALTREDLKSFASRFRDDAAVSFMVGPGFNKSTDLPEDAL